MAIYFARLYPYSPREGFRVRNFTTGGITFKGGPRPAWYRITPEQKTLLENTRQNPADRFSKPLFQFATEDQRTTIEEQERTQLIAASMLTKGSVIDPDIIPRSRVIDLTGGISEEPVTGGRADAIPPSRDIRPEMTATAGYVPNSDVVDDMLGENENEDGDEELIMEVPPAPQFIRPIPKASDPIGKMPPASLMPTVTVPKSTATTAAENDAKGKRGRPRKTVATPADAATSKSGGPILSKDVRK